jgi:hypothetical protein
MARQPTPAQRARARRDAALAAPPPRLRGMRASVRNLRLVIAGREYPISGAIDGDTPWEMTTDGASTVTLPIRSADGSLVEVLADEALLQRTGARVTIDGTVYVLSGVSADETGLYTLSLEDEVAWRLRQFTRFLSATRGTVTRAGFVRRMVEEASRPPRARMRSFIPEVRDVQPITPPSA